MARQVLRKRGGIRWGTGEQDGMGLVISAGVYGNGIDFPPLQDLMLPIFVTSVPTAFFTCTFLPI